MRFISFPFQRRACVAIVLFAGSCASAQAQTAGEGSGGGAVGSGAMQTSPSRAEKGDAAAGVHGSSRESGRDKPDDPANAGGPSPSTKTE